MASDEKYMINNVISGNMLTRRHMSRMSASDLSKLSKVPVQSIYAYESGGRIIPAWALAAISKAIDTPIDMFFVGAFEHHADMPDFDKLVRITDPTVYSIFKMLSELNAQDVEFVSRMISRVCDKKV